MKRHIKTIIIFLLGVVVGVAGVLSISFYGEKRELDAIKHIGYEFEKAEELYRGSDPQKAIVAFEKALEVRKFYIKKL